MGKYKYRVGQQVLLRNARLKQEGYPAGSCVGLIKQIFAGSDVPYRIEMKRPGGSLFYWDVRAREITLLNTAAPPDEPPPPDTVIDGGIAWPEGWP